MRTPRLFAAALFVFVTCLSANAQTFHFQYSGMTYVIAYPESNQVVSPEKEIAYSQSTPVPFAETVSEYGMESVYQPQYNYPSNTDNQSYPSNDYRAMNILDRPSRPGHFYGNTVRRRHHRGG